MFQKRSLPTVMSFILALAVVAFAQQPQKPVPDQGMRADREQQRQRRGHARAPLREEFGVLRNLDLTEAQRQQQRAIVERQMESIKAQREELFKLREKRLQGTFSAEDELRARALRQELHSSMQGINTEIEGILTAEQRAKLERFKIERKTRVEEIRKRRQERRENRPQP